MANLHCICGQRPHMQCHWFSQWRVSMIHQLCLLKRSYNRTNCCAEILVAVYLFCTFLKCSVSHSKYGLYVRYYEFFCNNGGTAVKLNTWNLKKNKKRGFTLIELIIVIVILAVLMAVAIPSLTGYINEAKTTGKIVECRQAVTAAQTTAIRHYGAQGKRQMALLTPPSSARSSLFRKYPQAPLSTILCAATTPFQSFHIQTTE